jgi:hypothetical protein
MPSSTPKQKRTMAAAAHDSAFAKKVGIPQPVAEEFNEADTAGQEKAEGEPPPSPPANPQRTLMKQRAMSHMLRGAR